MKKYLILIIAALALTACDNDKKNENHAAHSDTSHAKGNL